MEITFLGHSCFRIRTKKAIIIIDPYDPHIGIKMPKTNADIVAISHQHRDHNHLAAVSGIKAHLKPFVIAGPGEYEISGIYILGMPTFHDKLKGEKRGKNTVYLIVVDGMRLCHLGDLGHQLSEAQLEELNGIDILFIPVGGTYTVDARDAAEIVNRIEPKITIPMHYQLPGTTLKLASVDDFLEEMGAEKKEMVKLSAKAGDLPEEREVIVLKERA